MLRRIGVEVTDRDGRAVHQALESGLEPGMAPEVGERARARPRSAAARRRSRRSARGARQGRPGAIAQCDALACEGVGELGRVAGSRIPTAASPSTGTPSNARTAASAWVGRSATTLQSSSGTSRVRSSQAERTRRPRSSKSPPVLRSEDQGAARRRGLEDAVPQGLRLGEIHEDHPGAVPYAARRGLASEVVRSRSPPAPAEPGTRPAGARRAPSVRARGRVSRTSQPRTRSRSSRRPRGRCGPGGAGRRGC